MTSKTTVLAVVIGLIVLGLVVICGTFVVLMSDRTVPGEVWTLAGGIVGALAALLASTRSHDPTATP